MRALSLHMLIQLFYHGFQVIWIWPDVKEAKGTILQYLYDSPVEIVEVFIAYRWLYPVREPFDDLK